ncbi:metalloregulator ArsR/SmtB family transcription factor [Leifsonia sp. F6_8S_P_1B]|uniref:Metalloregulator ArsR/SmtB family transcription factor n=1 Tax=Leifsonia williamsii TaxID=3035919 RepID=A0ABT8K968_9MICO|nr:metalloregulator ArsR/SmtB family transcription factor [Leifsonia williamsii]MDN4613990.1 metalloregulator ArsR/SmtB family transcription factor [Leifsonia williamsii]
MSSDVFGALANPVRRAILTSLLEAPRSVNELAAGQPVGRPAVSEHLQVLVRAGLVRDERRGQQRIYHLEGAALAEAAEWLHPFERFWRGRLRALSAALDEEAAESEATTLGTTEGRL